MAVTIQDIAESLGISPAAVSLALNHRPGVSEETRRRVRARARAMGYDMSHLRSTEQNQGSVGLVHYQRRIHGRVDFFSRLLLTVERKLSQSGRRVTNLIIDGTGDVRGQLGASLDKECSGLVLLATEMIEHDLSPFQDLDLPLVVLDANLSDAGVDCIAINNQQGARQATRLLLAEGRGCPGYLGSKVPLRNFRERQKGFFSTVHEAGFATSSVQAHSLSPYIDDAEADFSALLDEGLSPASSYFADNDLLAIGAMRALLAHGYRIPEDVSLIGFDNTELAGYLTPALTSIDVPIDYFATVAARRMLELMGPGAHRPLLIEVGTTLVRRSSTLPR